MIGVRVCLRRVRTAIGCVCAVTFALPRRAARGRGRDTVCYNQALNEAAQKLMDRCQIFRREDMKLPFRARYPLVVLPYKNGIFLQRPSPSSEARLVLRFPRAVRYVCQGHEAPCQTRAGAMG